MSTGGPIFIDGQAFKPVEIPATGVYQLLRMESIMCYILVAPDGRQAWFSDEQMNDIVARNRGFHYTSDALRDLRKLIKLGLKPFHVDADFNVDGLKAIQ